MKPNNRLMALPLHILDELENSELGFVVIGGGNENVGVAPNNQTGKCDVSNNDSGFCSGTNNWTGSCGGTNNGTGRCSGTNNSSGKCGSLIIQ